MENGNVIIKSGSVTAANGKVERSAGASPVNHLNDAEDGGRVMFGLRNEFLRLMIAVVGLLQGASAAREQAFVDIKEGSFAYPRYPL